MATSSSQTRYRRGFATKVCQICYGNNPADEDLLTVRCRASGEHRGPQNLVTWSEKKGSLVSVRPLPNPPLPKGKYVRCNKGDQCQDIRCTYAHSEEELVVWNVLLEERRQHGPSYSMPPAPAQQVSHATAPGSYPRAGYEGYGKTAGPQPGSSVPAKHTASGGYGATRADVKINYEERSKNPPKLEDAQAQLTRKTYRSKFYSLLQYEEEEQFDVLSRRCDGEYLMIVYKKGDTPPWVRNGDPTSRYGCLSGLSGDQIMYASQSSECLFIVDHSGGQKIDVCAAQILPENMHGHHDELLIEFTREEAVNLERHYNFGAGLYNKEVRAEFEVKHLYFDFLHKSLKSLSDTQIAKVMPTAGDHVDHHKGTSSCSIPRPNVYDFLELDKKSQLSALQLVASSRSRAPVLVSGAFGTGKTRLLAVATHYFIEEGRQQREHIRVLLCCHHQITADTFIEEYFGRMRRNKSNPWNVRVVRLTRARYSTKTNYKYMYTNLSDFRYKYPRELIGENYLVVVTTFLTALNVHKTVGDKFFTHILLDEAAQVREPEAVAPLCMASQNTKIVIAGDDCQVGPGILVLGDVPQTHGLSKSLFTRLLELYNLDGLPVAVLNTNYRCHESIVSLAKSLFYPHDLQTCANPPLIPGVKQPLWFVCSSFEKKALAEKETDLREVKALTDQLKHFFPNPRQLEDVCIMASNRRQVVEIRTALTRQKRIFLPAQFLPTYQIQGREFKALFISTVETLTTSGCPFDPTKSLCNPTVFNTAITRAESLIVSVGNPYILMAVEDNMGTNQQCWAEYLHKCFQTATVVLPPGVKDDALGQLRKFVEEKRMVKPSATEPHARAVERAEERLPAIPVQVETTGAQVSAGTVPAPPTVEGTGVPVRMSPFYLTGKEIYLGLCLPGASINHLTIKMAGPFQDKSKAFANPQSLPQSIASHKVVQWGNQECILKLPAQYQPGVFMMVISSGVESSIRETFLLNIFDPCAVKLRLRKATCIVKQEQQWEADCSRAGPGFLEAKVNGTKILPIECSPSNLHIITFTPDSVGQYTLDVTYNSCDTGNSQTFDIHSV